MNKTYPQILKKLHFDMHTPQNVLNVGGDVDIDRLVKSIKDSKTESLTLFARCAYGFGYYPSKYTIPHPNLQRDVFGDITKALRKENIDVTAYFAVCRMSDLEWKATPRPDWQSVDIDGNPTPAPGMELVHTPCVTSGYLYEHILPNILECAKNYDINGIWIDGLYHILNTPCHCERCQKEFNEAVPEANGVFDGRLRFRWLTDKVWEFLNTVGIELDKIKPGATVGADTIGCPHWSRPYPEHVGFVTYDPQTENLPVSISFNMAATSWRGVAADMNIQRMKRWNDFNSRADEMLLTDAAVCASMNCMLITGDVVSSVNVQPNDGSVQLIANTFDYGEKIYNEVKDIPSYADMAIISSPEDTRANENPKEWHVEVSKIESAYQIAVASGLTAHVLFDDDVKDNINKYPLVVLPELAYIETNAYNAIKDYVANGGKLIVIGKMPAVVGAYQRDDSANFELMQELCGVKSYGYDDVKLSYFDIKGSEAQKYVPNSILTPVAVLGKPSLVKTTTAKTENYLYAHAPSYQFGSLPIGDMMEYSAITVNEFGKGKVVFLAQPILSAYSQLGNYMMKRLVGGVMKDNLNPYASLKGASNAQIIVAKGEDDLAVSVIVYHNDLRVSAPRIIDEVGLTAGLVATINDDRIPVSAKSVMGDDIDFTCENGVITIKFPPFKIYAGIVFKF